MDQRRLSPAQLTVTQLTVILLAGTTAWILGPFSSDRRPTRSHPTTVDPQVAAPARTPGPPPAEARVSTDDTAGDTTDDATDAAPTMLRPDGSSTATLNGATNVRALRDAWPRDRPWSAIVDVERSDAGVDWYVHADGTRTTTEMRWRSDLGRADAVTRIAHPVATDASMPPGADR